MAKHKKPPIILPMLVLFIVTTILYCHDKDNLSAGWILDDRATVAMHPILTKSMDHNTNSNNGDINSWSNTKTRQAFLDVNAYQQIWIKDFWGHDDLQSPQSHKSWRPLCTVTYYWNALWAGGVEEGKHSYYFHSVDRILHSIVTALVYPVTLYTCRNLSFQISHSTMAFLVALLFAAHPIHVEAVANTTGRAEVLCALFYFCGFCIYAKIGAGVSLSSSSPQNVSLWSSLMGVTLLLCFTTAAMLSKEHGVTLPIMAVVWGAYVGTNTTIVDVLSSCRINRISGGTNISNNKKRHKSNTKSTKDQHQRIRVGQLFLLRSILLAIGCISLCWWRLRKNGESGAALVCIQNPTACELNRFYRFVQFSYLWAFNFWLLVYPSNLSADWSGDGIPMIGENWATDLRFAVCVFVWIVICMFLACAISTAFGRMKSQNDHASENPLKEKKSDKHVDNHVKRTACADYDSTMRCIVTSFTWMLLPFLLTSNLVVYVGFVVADRTLYLPSFGYCLLLVQCLYHGIYNITLSIAPVSVNVSPNKNAVEEATTTPPLTKHGVVSKHQKFAFVYLIIQLGYTVKQQTQTKLWSSPVLIWGESYRVNPGGHISLKEYATSLVNEGRNVDALEIYSKMNKYQLSNKKDIGYTQSIQNVRNPPTGDELKMLKMTYVLNVLTDRFKYATALGNAGQCDVSAPLIEEAFSWMGDMERDIAELIRDNNAYAKDAVLNGIYQNLQTDKAYFFIAKSRCADTVDSMASLAQAALQLRPNMPYVLNYANSVHGIVQNVMKSGLKLTQVKITRILLENKQTVDTQFSLITS